MTKQKGLEDMISKKNKWTKESVFNELKGRTRFSSDGCIIETVEGHDSSMIISMSSIDRKPISVTMNGKEMLADIIVFSLAKEERIQMQQRNKQAQQ